MIRNTDLVHIAQFGRVANPTKTELRANPVSYFGNKDLLGITIDELGEWQRRRYVREQES